MAPVSALVLDWTWRTCPREGQLLDNVADGETAPTGTEVLLLDLQPAQRAYGEDLHRGIMGNVFQPRDYISLFQMPMQLSHDTIRAGLTLLNWIKQGP